MSAPSASAMILVTDRAFRTMIRRDRISVGQGKLREDKAREFSDAMEAAFKELQRALADRLKAAAS